MTVLYKITHLMNVVAWYRHAPPYLFHGIGVHQTQVDQCHDDDQIALRCGEDHEVLDAGGKERGEMQE